MTLICLLTKIPIAKRIKNTLPSAASGAIKARIIASATKNNANV